MAKRANKSAAPGNDIEIIMDEGPELPIEEYPPIILEHLDNGDLEDALTVLNKYRSVLAEKKGKGESLSREELIHAGRSTIAFLIQHKKLQRLKKSDKTIGKKIRMGLRLATKALDELTNPESNGSESGNVYFPDFSSGGQSLDKDNPLGLFKDNPEPTEAEKEERKKEMREREAELKAELARQKAEDAKKAKPDRQKDKGEKEPATVHLLTNKKEVAGKFTKQPEQVTNMSEIPEKFYQEFERLLDSNDKELIMLVYAVMDPAVTEDHYPEIYEIKTKLKEYFPETYNTLPKEFGEKELKPHLKKLKTILESLMS